MAQEPVGIEQPKEPIRPEAAAEAAAANLIQEQNAAIQKQREEDFNIIDPGKRREAELSPAAKEAIKPEEKKPDTIPGAVADGGLTPELLARAQQWDVSEAEAKQIGPEVLKRHLDKLDSQVQYQQPEQPEYQQDPRYQQWLWQQQQQAQQQQQLQLPDIPPPLDPEKYEPDLVAAWEAQRQGMWHQQQLLRQQHQAILYQQQQQQAFQQQQQQAQAQQEFRTVEGLIQKDEGMADVLGQGPADRVEYRHLAARDRIAKTMNAIQYYHAQYGWPVPDTERLYQMAKNQLYPERIQAKAQEEVAQRARNAAGQFIRPPTSTTRNEDDRLSPEERAERAVARIQRNGR